MVIPDLIEVEELELFSGDEEEKNIPTYPSSSCPHVSCSAPLLRSSKLEKSITKLKTQLDQFAFICLHCTRVFTCDSEATLHGVSSVKHNLMLNLTSGDIVCAQCPQQQPFREIGAHIKRSQQTDIATLYLTIISKQKKQVKPARVITHKRTEKPVVVAGSGPRGLKNLGNTCFFNSSLQLLVNSQHVKRAVLQDGSSFGPITSALAQFTHTIEQQPQSTLSPKCLFEVVCDKAANHLGDGAQHDAQELLMFLLAGMDEETMPQQQQQRTAAAAPCPFRADHEWRTKHAEFWFPGLPLDKIQERVAASDEDDEPGGWPTLAFTDLLDFTYRAKQEVAAPQEGGKFVNVAKDLFQMEIDSVVTCEVCHGVSKQREVHSMLSLAVDSQGNETLQDCVRTYFSTPDKLQVAQKNGYRCDKCKQERNAKREFVLHSAGDVVLLHLKRFRHTGNRFTKAQDTVEAPLELDLGRDLGEYRLVGFIEHLGQSLTKGHYIAYIVQEQQQPEIPEDESTTTQWFRCSDDHITAVPAKQAMQAQVYIAMYERM